MSRPRSAKSSASSAALGFAAPRARRGDVLAGDAASPAALTRLEAAVGDLRQVAAEPILQRAIAELRRDNAQAASEWALKALNLDDRNGMAWYVLAVAREKANDFRSSLKAYESALALLPDEGSLAIDLGRLAYRLGMTQLTEQLFRRHLERDPGSVDAANNLACIVRDQRRNAEAIEILRPAIVAHPDNAMLWNTLGTVVAEQGDMPTAITFYEEAMRFDPDFVKPRYNRGNARLALGLMDEALDDCEAALKAATAPDDRAMIRLSRSTIRLCRGDLGGGWDDYEARLDPYFAKTTQFLTTAPAWTPDADLAGKTLLVYGEQGLGDEVLFANLIPDLLGALGPDGKLLLAVEPRLVSLFQRSFPAAEVGAHATYSVDGRTVRGAAFAENRPEIDLWAPLGSLLRRFRRSVAEFPAKAGFLVPDPARVAHWRGLLAEAGAAPKVGIVWKSMLLDGDRSRYYSPFHLWAPVLTLPGVRFVNVQYGDCAEEIALARREFGVDIWEPPGIDLKDDLDDLAALTRALDLTLGFANATSNIAASVGAPLWMVSAPGAWTRLGTDRLPWYPQARVFIPAAFSQWDVTMGEVAAALGQHFG